MVIGLPPKPKALTEAVAPPTGYPDKIDVKGAGDQPVIQVRWDQVEAAYVLRIGGAPLVNQHRGVVTFDNPFKAALWAVDNIHIRSR